MYSRVRMDRIWTGAEKREGSDIIWSPNCLQSNAIRFWISPMLFCPRAELESLNTFW